MTNYTLHNTVKQKSKTSKVARAKYNHATKQLYSKHPVNLKQAMNLIYWEYRQG